MTQIETLVMPRPEQPQRIEPLQGTAREEALLVLTELTHKETFDSHDYYDFVSGLIHLRGGTSFDHKQASDPIPSPDGTEFVFETYNNDGKSHDGRVPYASATMVERKTTEAGLVETKLPWRLGAAIPGHSETILYPKVDVMSSLFNYPAIPDHQVGVQLPVSAVMTPRSSRNTGATVLEKVLQVA